ncbi:PREDICTED: urokinase plasminogen activator surface receptor isoform X2 [Propithecus coquereli]|uniref:urokinase plasminogen activator surface receptor isoform X2 n=1 Tax=Propithecus coquereli TaxID=379532 RepID=UPI00063F7444|nr:PREDICTED: urokinase plasminogen activator surface receptor isoform X2 [Propithecus coquereli]
MGRPPLLLLLPPLLLLAQTRIPASWALQCMRCERSSYCQVEECAPGQDLCRTTVMRICEGGLQHDWKQEELEVVERGCAYPEKTNRTMSYRTGLQIITLTETMCGGDFCNRPHPGRRAPGRHAPSFPRSRYLECVSCASSDMSCERGREQSLQCGSPTEQCLEVVTYRSLEGDLNDEQHTRGCGYLPGCPGPTGFHNNHTFHFLQCCNTTKCNGGPVVELQDLPLNGFQCHSCEGNSTHGCSSEETSLIDCRGPMNQCLEATGTNGPGTPSYTVRGCATDSWCQRVHVADAFSLTHINVTCCNGSGCNHPAWDVQHRRGGTPRPGPARLSLTVTLLLTARLWGGTLLWT